MSNQMKDFLNWLDRDSPEWVRYVSLILFVFLVPWALFLLGVLVVWALADGYWIIFVLLPAIGIGAILRAYQKSKEKQDE